MTLRPLTIEEAARVMPALEHCPHHPNAIVLPFYGFRSCCLLAALQAIREGAENPVGIAQEVYKDALGKVPRFPLWKTR